MFTVTKKILLILLILLLIVAIILSGYGISDPQVKWWSLTVFALFWLLLITVGVLNENVFLKNQYAIGAILCLLAVLLIIMSGLHIQFARQCADCMHWSAVLGILIGVLTFMYGVLHMRREPVENTVVSPETIFVSIASYRDKNCPQTVRSLFENAAKPSRITVGICQQNDPEQDPDCYPEEWRERIRIMRLPYIDARGPTYARYLCSTLWSGEKYYLQIDAHVLFAKDWDEKLIQMIKRLHAQGVKKPLLSHYTKLHSDYYNAQDDKNTVPTICKSFFNDDKIISFEGAKNITTDKSQAPRPAAYIAGGMMFAESSFLKEVPYDPNLPYLFVGEEILHTVRFWTNGWDIFTPSENVIYHYYTRENEPKIWTDNKHFNSKEAMNKVKFLLELDTENIKEVAPHLSQNLDVYGLGTQRTLEDYFKFAGIDLKEKKVTKDFCE